MPTAPNRPLPRRRRLLPAGLALVALVALLAWAGAGAGLRAEGERMFDPRFREGAPSDELVAGPPRLSRGHLSAYVDLLESAFDVALPAQEEQALRDALETEFERGDKAAREAFLALVEPVVRLRDKVREGDRAAALDGLRAYRAAIDRRIAAAPDRPAHRMVTALLARRHEVLWLGEPVVKGVSVDAYLELVEFVAGLARNQAVRLSPGRRSALRDYLGSDLRAIDRALRLRLAAVHRTWLMVKAKWDRAKDARRFLMRWEALQLLARLAPGNPPLKIVPGMDLAAYAREAARVAAVQPPYDAITSLARNPAGLLDAVRKGLDLPDAAPEFPFVLR